MNTYISVLRKLSLFSVAVLLFLPLAAQYGPMGIGNADGSEAPAGTSQPRLLLWLDGSSVTVSNNQNVMVWPDKSGNDHHFVSENTSVAPVFKSTGGPGNRSYVQFNKADNRMYCQNFPMSNDGYSIYFVVRSNDNRYGVFSYGSAADPKELVLYNDNGLRVDMGSSTQNTVINDIDNGDWAYGGILHDIGSIFWNYRKVGESESNSNFGNGETISPTGTAVIGNIQQSLNGGFLPDDALAGDIAEVIVWEGALNRGQSRLMRTYLWTKYGAPFRRNGNNGWDKFRGYASGSGGKYYEPVGIGRDNGGANSGQHSEARLKGLVLRVNTGQWTQGRSYTVAGYNGATNSIVTSGVPAGVDNRWSRTWEINGADGNQQVRVAFDFGEGISGGDIPQEAENFVLLYRNGTTGNFTLFSESNIIEKAIVDDEVVFTVQRSNINTNNRYYTIGTTNAGVSSLDGSALRTWYAYQSGNWDDPSTWTLDGSASPTYVNAGGNIPGTGDAVVVGSGRTVTCNLNNRSQTVLKVFGTVDFNTTSGHNMGTISGNGTIRCAGSGGNGNFPAGNLTAFANPNTGGQTVFYGSGFTQTANLELNRVRVEMNSATSQITMAANFTHNGLLEIKTGTFQVNGASATRNIESFGNVLIEPQGRIRVSGTNRTHSWTFHGDLVNEGGDIRFTNRTAQNHGSNDPQRVITRFVDGTKNQRLVANGTSYFSQIVVNKGSNSTYVLTVSAENAGDFGLFGRSAQNMGSSAYFNEGSQDNALALVNGTIEIRENVFIPLHYGGGNYNINETATLWVNGGSAGKGPVLVPGASTGTAIVPYGKILVTDGLLRADCGSGITTRSNGIIQVDGGEVYATQIRTSVFGPANVGGIIINGGLVDVDGTRAGGPANNFYIFSLTYTGNLFRMTGGTLRVAGPTGAGLIFINSDPEQTSVSGGTVIAEVNNTSTNYRISSRAPFWDLEVQRSNNSGTNRPVIIRGGSSDGVSIPDLPLRIENRLTITSANSPTLQMGTGAANSLDAYIRGNFVVENGGVYEHFENTTHFTGGSNSLLSLPTGSTQTFHNVVVEKNDESRFAQISAGNTTMAMEVLGDFHVERGFFNNTNRNVRILGNVINRQAFGVESATGVVSLEGTSTQEIFSDNGIFHSLTLNNPNDVLLKNGDLRVRRIMRLENNCHFFLGSYKLRVESETGQVQVPSIGSNPNACFVTDGSPGAGGLEIIFRTPTAFSWYNLGVEDGGAVKYTPAFVRVNGNWDDEGFVRIVPVNSRLSLLDFSTATDYLNFYWNVSHSEFEQIPNVSQMFVYDNSDIESGGNANNFVSGRVLFDAPFEREFDALSGSATGHVNTSSRRVFYNNTDVAQNNNGSGILLTNAAYTAGQEDLFDGRPQVFYSRNSAKDADFNTAAQWNELGQFGTGADIFDYHGTGVSGNTDYPQEGDIAFIGFDPGSGRPHSYKASAAGVAAAEVRFTPMQNASGDRLPRYYGANPTDITVLRPTLSFGNTSEIENINSISGEGAILMRGDVDLSVVDLGNFLVEDSSIVMVESDAATLNLSHLPAEVPNLFCTTSGNGSNFKGLRIQSNLKVRGDMEIIGNARFNLNTGATGDISVGRDLKLAKYQAVTSSPWLSYQNFGTARSIEVFGNLRVEGDGTRIQVLAPTSFNQVIHNLTVHKNIYQNTPAGIGLNLFTGPSNDYIALTLRGDGNHNFVNEAGLTPKFGRLLVDKGNDLTSGFSFNSQIIVDAPADGNTKPIELRNGLLTINHTSTDITLSDGGANFSIPSTAGLALEAGTLRIRGNEIGMNLSGLLKVDGGLFEVGNSPGQNNYIEYSSGGNAKIEVNGGQLFVGSQVRQGLTNTAGVLDYRQTGGEVRLGIYDAPSANRPVLEVTNDGSRFDLTGGSLTLVRGINSNSVPSLRLNPTNYITSGTADLIIGNANSPTGAQMKNIGIQSQISLPSLRINNDSGSDPVVKIYTSNLTLEDYLDIDGGATLETGIYDLTLRGDIDNDGTLVSTGGTLILDHILSDVTGSGVFDLNDLERIGGGVTVFDTDLLVKGDFDMDNGTADFGVNELRVQGNAQIDGELRFTAGQGMVMDGVGAQILRRSAPGESLIDILTIDNSSGVNMITGTAHEFTIGEELRMSRGVFNLNGNLLTLGLSADIVQLNAFGPNNMISTGGAFTNFGVLKEIAANVTEDVFLPLGLNEYMPVLLNFSEDGYSSGSTPSSYLTRLVTGPQNATIPPRNNVLQMYFSFDVQGVGSDLRMDMELAYDQSYVALTGANTEEDYIGARIVNGSPQPAVFKFGTTAVNAEDNLITFSFDGVNSDGISGDYFAGIDAQIPDLVPVYTTIRDGDATNSQGSLRTFDNEVSGGGAPNGAVVIIDDDHVLNMNVNNITFYKTIIEPDATLEIDGTSFHRLGIVEGTGTIKLVNTGTLPSGSYNDFLTCIGGRLEYSGTEEYEVLASLPTVRSVSITGSGVRKMANNDVNICEDLLVDGADFRFGSQRKLTIEGDLLINEGSFDTDQGDLEVKGQLNITGGEFTSGNEGERLIRGDIIQTGGISSIGSGGTTELFGNYTKSAGSYNGGTASASFIMKGTEEQFLAGDFLGANAFRRLELNNPEGVRLHNNIEVNNTILLTNGKLFTAEDSMLHLTAQTVNVQPIGGSPQSFVNGPMQWTLTAGSSTGSERFFPVGKGNNNRPLQLSNRSATRTWTVEYYDTLAVMNPNIETLTPNDLAVATMSRREYWRVNSNTGANTTARVGLSWGNNSSVAESPNDYDKLLVMKYIPTDSLWASLGGTQFNFNAVNNLGSFIGTTNASFSESFFTLGSGDAINPLPVTWLYFNGDTDGRYHTLKWATASEINNDYFELERSVDGRFFTSIARIEGGGNSNTRLDYSYVDKMAPTGRVYYRLRQIDYNGEYDYADQVVTLLREEGENERLDFLLYPNPTSEGTVRLMISDFDAEMAIISISDLSGQVLLRDVVWIDEQGISDFIRANFAPGAYIVSVLHDGAMRSKPLIITK